MEYKLVPVNRLPPKSSLYASKYSPMIDEFLKSGEEIMRIELPNCEKQKIISMRNCIGNYLERKGIQECYVSLRKYELYLIRRGAKV